MLLNFIEVALFIFYLQLFNIIDLGLGTGGVSIILIFIFIEIIVLSLAISFVTLSYLFDDFIGALMAL